MPKITEFDGLVIEMYFGLCEHNPPHFHVHYGSIKTSVSISTCQLLEGNLPPNKMARVKDWWDINKEALSLMWTTGKIAKLPPL